MSRLVSLLTLLVPLLFIGCINQSGDDIAGEVKPGFTGDIGSQRPILIGTSMSNSFGNVEVSDFGVMTMGFVNSGGKDAKVSTAYVTSPLVTIISDGCEAKILKLGDICSVTLRYSPVVIGNLSDILTIPYTDSSAAPYLLNTAIAGHAVAIAPSIAGSPNTWDFGNVPTATTLTKVFTLSNSTSEVGTVGTVVISGAGYSVSANTCTSANLVSGGATCNITINFSPSVPGSSLGLLTIPYTGSAGGYTTTISLSAIGDVPQPTLTLSPSPHNFGNVSTNTYAQQTITVSNNTTVTATTGVPTITGTDYIISGTTCNSIVLSANSSCVVNVRFTPNSTGISSGTLTVPYTSAQAISYSTTASLAGTGVAPTVSFSFSGFTGNVGTDSTGLVSTGVTLRWTAQPLATYYIITRTGGPTGTVVSPQIFHTSSNSYAVSGLDPSQSYQFKINAFDSISTSDGNNNWVTINTPSTTGATFNGWADLVSTGSVFTDVSTVDDAKGLTGVNRVDRNLNPVTGFSAADIDTAANTVTFSNYYSLNNIFPTGEKFKVYSTGSLPAPLSNGDTVYLIQSSASVYRFATSYANALAGTGIDLTTAGSGNSTLQPTARVKVSWVPFTIAPSGTPASHNIYRSNTSGSGFTLIGNTTGAYFTDYEVSDQATYYYKVFPVIASVEVPTATSSDQEIKVYVPPQNMIFAHRWIINRETCINMMGINPSNINRSDNYSCSYTWGQGFAPSILAAQKSKWDMGYGIISDRWKRGCKVTTTGPMESWQSNVAPAGEIYNYGDTGYAHTSQYCLQGTGSGSNTEAPASARTNYPGYSPANMTNVSQTQTYAICQGISIAGVSDGNGHNKLRLPRKHETLALRAYQTNQSINKYGAALKSLVKSGTNLPANGACRTPGQYNHIFPNGLSSGDPSIPFNYSSSNLVSGAFAQRNCVSNYDLSDYAGSGEYTSDQVFCGTTDGSCVGMQSSIDDGASFIEDFLMDGNMGTVINLHYSHAQLGSYMIPMLGLTTFAVDAGLGSRDMGYNPDGYTYNSGNQVYPVVSPRAMMTDSTDRESWGLGAPWSAVNFRCVGVVP